MITDIKSDYIRLRNKSDNGAASGLELWLLPEGGTAPGDLIALTANTGITWQYDFPAGVTNGTYTLYSGTAGSQVPVQHASENVQVPVARSGIIGPENTNFNDPDW